MDLERKAKRKNQMHRGGITVGSSLVAAVVLFVLIVFSFINNVGYFFPSEGSILSGMFAVPVLGHWGLF